MLPPALWAHVLRLWLGLAWKSLFSVKNALKMALPSAARPSQSLVIGSGARNAYVVAQERFSFTSVHQERP
jgi:hypothetical protein